MPDSLEVTARSDSGVIMAMRHAQYPVHGVQFHPESILTEHGKDLLGNFLMADWRTSSEGGRMSVRDALAKLVLGEDLTRAEAEPAMRSLVDGEATPSQIAAFAIALRMKGETADEIAGLAEVMRGAATRVDAGAGRGRRGRHRRRRRRAPSTSAR